jgi:hypothetical protein
MIAGTKPTPKEILDQAPRFDLEAEAGLNGAAILKPELLPAMIDAGYRPSIFHDETSKLLCTSILEVFNRCGTVDTVLVRAELATRFESSAETPASLIAHAARSCPVQSNWPHYLDLVRTCWQHRQNRLIGEQLLVASTNGEDPATIASRVARALELTSEAVEKITYRRYTCAELDAAEFNIEYLVEYLLVRGQPCILAGPKKALKTSIAIDLAISLATRGMFLGFFRCTRACKVLMMSGESGMTTIQETARRQCAAAGWNLADVTNLVFSDQLPRISSAEHLNALRKFIQADEAEILFLDPAYLMMDTGGKESSIFAMGELLANLNELCQSMGVTLILLHHCKQGVNDPFAMPELDNMSWAGFQEFARQWLLLGRRERYRPESEPGVHKLWMNCGGSAGHAATWAIDVCEGAYDGTTARYWEVEVAKASEAIRTAEEEKAEQRAEKTAEKKRIQLEADKQAIIRGIGTTIDTATAIRQKCGVHPSRFPVALAELMDEGHVADSFVFKGNRSWEAIKLKGTPDPAPAQIPSAETISTSGTQSVQIEVCTDRTGEGASVQHTLSPLGERTCTDDLSEKSTPARKPKKRRKKCTDATASRKESGVEAG